MYKKSSCRIFIHYSIPILVIGNDEISFVVLIKIACYRTVESVITYYEYGKREKRVRMASIRGEWTINSKDGIRNASGWQARVIMTRH